MIQDILNILMNLFNALPYEMKIGLVILIVLLFCGYENQQKAKRAAEESAKRKTMRTGKPGTKATSSSAGEVWHDETGRPHHGKPRQ